MQTEKQTETNWKQMLRYKHHHSITEIKYATHAASLRVFGCHVFLVAAEQLDEKFLSLFEGDTNVKVIVESDLITPFIKRVLQFWDEIGCCSTPEEYNEKNDEWYQAAEFISHLYTWSSFKGLKPFIQDSYTAEQQAHRDKVAAFYEQKIKQRQEERQCKQEERLKRRLKQQRKQRKRDNEGEEDDDDEDDFEFFHSGYNSDDMYYSQIASNHRRKLFDYWIQHIKEIYEFQIQQEIAYKGFKGVCFSHWGFKNPYHYREDTSDEEEQMETKTYSSLTSTTKSAKELEFETYLIKVKNALTMRRYICAFICNHKGHMTIKDCEYINQLIQTTKQFEAVANTYSLDEMHFILSSILIDVELVRTIRNVPPSLRSGEEDQDEDVESKVVAIVNPYTDERCRRFKVLPASSYCLISDKVEHKIDAAYLQYSGYSFATI